MLANLICSNLKVEMENVVGSYPSQIHYYNIQQWSHSLSRGRSGHELYIVARIQLDVLRCRFLIQRLNVSRCQDSGLELLHIAQEMMAVVLSLWLHRDHLKHFNYVLNWIVSTSVIALITAKFNLGGLLWNPMRWTSLC